MTANPMTSNEVAARDGKFIEELLALRSKYPGMMVLAFVHSDYLDHGFERGYEEGLYEESDEEYERFVAEIVPWMMNNKMWTKWIPDGLVERAWDAIYEMVDDFLMEKRNEQKDSE